MIYIDMGLQNQVYFEQMALTSRITDSEAASRVREEFKSSKPLNARLEAVRAELSIYCAPDDARHCRIPLTREYRRQHELSGELQRQWHTSSHATTEMLRVPEIAADGVRATVERFDQNRSFGFVDVPSLHDTAFLHMTTLEKDNFARFTMGTISSVTYHETPRVWSYRELSS